MSALLLTIDGTLYSLQCVTPRAFYLQKHGTKLKYLVQQIDGSWVCSCPTHRYRHCLCKHEKALREVGLIEANDGMAYESPCKQTMPADGR